MTKTLAILVLVVGFSTCASANLTSCTNGPNVDDGSGGAFASGTCDFYREASAYPFDLTNFLTNNGTAPLAENYLTPGYIVFTTDSTEVTTQVGSDPSAWQDVLFFEDTYPGVPASTAVDLYWGASLPSLATVDAFTTDSTPGDGVFYIQWDPSGINTLAFTNISYTVHDTPEPSTVFMTFVLMAVIGLVAGVNRKRRRV